MMGLSGPLTRVDMWRAPFGLKDCPESMSLNARAQKAAFMALSFAA
jgi:hypothetical protein